MGPMLDCANLLAGPFTPNQVISAFGGSEDIAFDGKGHIAGKSAGSIVLVDSTGVVTSTVAMNVPQAYGLRYRPDGLLVVALPQNGKVITISPDGTVTDLVTGLAGPNGIYADLEGNVWLTEIQGDRVSRIAPDKTITVVASGQAANSANGIVVDSLRSLVFYTDYGAGKVRRLDMSQPGAAPEDVVTIDGTKLDGMALDACGNIYVVDQGGSRLFRVRLDASGAAKGPAELLAEFPENVANAQFGSGPGFEPTMLYAAGNPGVVYAVPVGVPGAPVPTVP
ncbi:gluconolactonase [Polyangium aurulentum]|uniref:Vgb family protein n=1 Tax=Polyangium aurulentum TaxID=2567896 RepID=UPI0010AE087A|nr:gluconolactonase [Polyangium aurulentum]UQA58028.1 gluconolactonase [Polyangium aurulentum]